MLLRNFDPRSDNFWVKQASIVALKHLGKRWLSFAAHPLGYVIGITLLAGVGYSFSFMWRPLGLVALLWGSWLIWQFFQEDPAESKTQIRLAPHLEQALAYQAQIEQLIRSVPPGNRPSQQQQLLIQIKHWVQAIHDLGQHISHIGQDDLIHCDIKRLPKAIKDLEQRLELEPDDLLHNQLQQTIATRKKQLTSLERLHRTVVQAEIQIEDTLSLLGTIYSHLLTDRSTHRVAGYNRLSDEITEEVDRLQDHLEALEEVRLGRID